MFYINGFFSFQLTKLTADLWVPFIPRPTSTNWPVVCHFAISIDTTIARVSALSVDAGLMRWAFIVAFAAFFNHRLNCNSNKDYFIKYQ